MPLHVTDTPHRLKLRSAGAELIEVPKVALLQQVLAATVPRELVSHKTGERRGDMSVQGLFHRVQCEICSENRYSRSTADNNAAHSVGEAIRKQARDVIVHDLHLTTLELSNLVQADLMLLWVLRAEMLFLLRVDSEQNEIET